MSLAPATADAPVLAGPTVLGLGAALPDGEATNAALAGRLGLGEDWFARRTGVRRRRVLAPGETVADLATRAARAALRDADLDAAEVDLVVVATVSADDLMPACAVLVADALGARGVPAFDVGAACAGFVVALATADALLQAGRARTALVVGAEGLTRIVAPDDRRTAGLFGDGAGAVVLRAGAGPLAGLVWGSDGTQRESIRAPRERGTIAMAGHETYLAAVERMTRTVEEVCAAAGTTPADADLVVLHQANARITAAVAERLGLDPERVPDRIAEVGNVSAASVPVALHALRAEGRLRPGDRVVCSTLGSGITWAGCLLTLGERPTATDPESAAGPDATTDDPGEAAA